MPIYEYEARSKLKSCSYCSKRFGYLQKSLKTMLRKCPKCGAPVKRLISAASVGVSRSGFDSRAKDAGFHKLQRVDKGTYEKKY